MALVVDGIPVSGSIGLRTYSRNRFGNYNRTRTSPVNTNTDAQNNARAAFRNGVNAWIALSSGVKAGWETYAAAVPWTNRAGQTVHLSGIQHFVRYYSFYVGYLNTLPASLLAPSIFDLGFLNIPTIDAGATIDISAQTLEVTGSAVSAANTWDATGGILGIETSRPQNLGNRFPAGPWASLGYSTGAGTGDYSFTRALNTMRNPPADGQQIWLRFRGLGVPATDRRLSTPQIVGPIIVNSVA